MGTSAELWTNLQKTYELRLAEIESGARHVYQGPLVGQDGKEVIPAGETLADDAILGMDWHVEGVNSPLPK